MPDDDYEYDEDGNLIEETDDRFARLPRDQVRRLERKAKLADKVPDLEQKVAEYERRDLFRAVGIDPEDTKAKWFAKGYDGAMTPEAIKAAAIEGGFMAPDKAEVSDEELAAHGALASAAAGAVGNQSVSQDQAYQAELAAAQDPAAATQVMLKYGKSVSTYQQ